MTVHEITSNVQSRVISAFNFSLVVESVENLEQTGLNVKVVIADQVSNNRRDF